MLGSEMLVGQVTVYGMFAGEALDGWNPDVVLIMMLVVFVCGTCRACDISVCVAVCTDVCMYARIATCHI